MTTIRSATKRRTANLIEPKPSQSGYSPHAILFGAHGLGSKSHLNAMLQRPLKIDELTEYAAIIPSHWDSLRIRTDNPSLWVAEPQHPSNELIKFLDRNRPENSRHGKVFANYDDLHLFAVAFRMSLHRFYRKSGDLTYFIHRMPPVPLYHSFSSAIRSDPRFGLAEATYRTSALNQFKLLDIKFEFVGPWGSPETEQMWRDLYKYLEM